MFVIHKCAISLDGHLNHRQGTRLILSNADDLEHRDQMRTWADVVLVGAETIRSDNPRLLINSPQQIDRRTRDGRAPQPYKATITRSGRLAPLSDFFIQGVASKLIYCPEQQRESIVRDIDREDTEVIGLEPCSIKGLLDDLDRRELSCVLLEGGGKLAAQFYEAGLIDELQLSIAPMFVADSQAPRWIENGHSAVKAWPGFEFISSQSFGQIVMLRYKRKK